MAYRLTARKELPIWRTQDGRYIQAGESFVIEGPNLNSYGLQKAIERVKGPMASASGSTPSPNHWIIEKL